MPHALHPTETAAASYAHAAGEEPLPGYRLLEPLGRGGFGEVWKCEAPGGLHKAIKFVPSDESSSSLRQEYDAFQQIKAIRHPFLLQLERVELFPDELVMVMELADMQLQDRFVQCRAEGLPGVPRDELLGYLADAAEALDLIGGRHGLQHLDVKPANLFIICGRVKVGDYGLLTRSSTVGATNRGLTPRYVAPEVLKGNIDPRSDQYSLALVYQELLTGTFPYAVRNAQQMMMAHTTAAPDLSGLALHDRGAVAVALAKQPEARFPSCLAFVQALMMGGPSLSRHDTHAPTDTTTFDAVRRSRVATASEYLSASAAVPMPTARTATPAPPRAFGTPAPMSLIPPKSHGGSSRAFVMPPEPELLLSAASEVVLNDELLKSVLPVDLLAGRGYASVSANGDWFTQTLVAVAQPTVDALGRGRDGLWKNRFRTSHPLSVARHKLESLLQHGEWFDEIDDSEPGRFLLVRHAAAGLWGKLGGKKSGLELEIRWPMARGGGEVALAARLFGEPDSKFTRGVAEAMPRLIHTVKNLLRHGEERRREPRLLATFPMNLYPLADDGRVLPALRARCRNLSLGGFCCASYAPPPTKYVFAEFLEVGDLGNLAVLVRVLRTQSLGAEHLVAGKFRLDLV